jgi:hypothetical protein
LGSNDDTHICLPLCSANLRTIMVSLHYSKKAVFAAPVWVYETLPVGAGYAHERINLVRPTG